MKQSDAVMGKRQEERIVTEGLGNHGCASRVWYLSVVCASSLTFPASAMELLKLDGLHFVVLFTASNKTSKRPV